LFRCEVALDTDRLWTKEKAVSALAALLQSDKKEAVCWALPALKRQNGIEAEPSLCKEIISCSSLSELPISKAENLKVVTICSNLTEKKPFTAAAQVIDDEDLYG
jgi:hypothetical protein